MKKIVKKPVKKASRVADLEVDVDMCSGRIDIQRGDIADMAVTIRALTSDVVSARSVATDAQGRINELQKQVRDLICAVGSLRNDISSLRTNKIGLDDFMTLRRRVDAMVEREREHERAVNVAPQASSNIERMTAIHDALRGLSAEEHAEVNGRLDQTDHARKYGPSLTERLTIRDGGFIEAIKSLRARTYLGLKQAKEIVDVVRHESGYRAGIVVEPPRSGGGAK